MAIWGCLAFAFQYYIYGYTKSNSDLWAQWNSNTELLDAYGVTSRAKPNGTNFISENGTFISKT